MGAKPVVQIRESVEGDTRFIAEWLKQPGVLRGFPMCNDQEIQDSIRFWIHYINKGCSLTALYRKRPCGCANLYIQTIEKLKHQCLFVVIVDEKYRGQGVGTILLKSLMKKAREKFHIELIHLEVYEDNPAISLYKRLGFVEYGRHPRYLKEMDGTYYDKVMMQRSLID
jgi:RimJ/RimL family protein N-acetyltransferase